MLRSLKSTTKSIQEASKSDHFTEKYEELMKISEKLVLKHQLLVQNSEEVLSDSGILELPDIKLGQKLKFSSTVDAVNLQEFPQQAFEKQTPKAYKNFELSPKDYKVDDKENQIVEDYESGNGISGSFIIPEVIYDYYKFSFLKKSWRSNQKLSLNWQHSQEILPLLTKM